MSPREKPGAALDCAQANLRQCQTRLDTARDATSARTARVELDKRITALLEREGKWLRPIDTLKGLGMTRAAHQRVYLALNRLRRNGVVELQETAGERGRVCRWYRHVPGPRVTYLVRGPGRPVGSSTRPPHLKPRICELIKLEGVA